MSLTTLPEAAAVIARLSTLAGGRVYDGVPDDTLLVFDPATGKVRPFIVLSFGEPLPTAKGRGLGVTEAGQPHIMPLDVTYVAGTQAEARVLSAAGNALLIGWVPNSPNSGELIGVGGNSFTTLDALNKPTRYSRIRYMSCVINMAA